MAEAKGFFGDNPVFDAHARGARHQVEVLQQHPQILIGVEVEDVVHVSHVEWVKHKDLAVFTPEETFQKGVDVHHRRALGQVEVTHADNQAFLLCGQHQGVIRVTPEVTLEVALFTEAKADFSLVTGRNINA